MDEETPSANSKRARSDANRDAFAVARDILAAAHDFEFSFGDKALRVVASQLPTPPWPSVRLDGLSPEADGPWPAPVSLDASWPGGKVTLLFRTGYWRGTGKYRGLVALRMQPVGARRRVLWITLPLALLSAKGAKEAVVEASFVPFRKHEPVEGSSLSEIVRDVMARAGFPFSSEFHIEAFRVSLPEGRVLPSSQEAFARLVRLSILKLPFLEAEGVKGELPFEVAGMKGVGADLTEIAGARPGAAVKEAVPVRAGGAVDDKLGPWLPGVTANGLALGKYASLASLPGGVRQYKETLDTLVTEVSRRPLTVDTFNDFLQDRYNVKGPQAVSSYLTVLKRLRLCRVDDRRLEITPEGKAYLARRDPTDLFGRLHKAYAGVLETLLIIEGLEFADNERTPELLRALLGTTWGTNHEASFRRNWLLSLGLTQRSDKGDSLTELGRRVLEMYEREARPIRERLGELIGETGGDATDDDDDDDAPSGEPGVGPGLDPQKPPPRAEPAAWTADRVDLRPEHVAPHARDLELPEATVVRAAAALSTGKHLLLVGPPGTGKTKLAHALVEAAKAEDYCAGAFVATASADWTTFDTIGGYALHRDNQLRFRPGALLRAVKQWQWLVIDELNRADVDRAFGELMTVLAGDTTDTAYEGDDGATIRVGPDVSASHPTPRTFRVLATMNTWDKTSLFRLSYAVQRRFAIVHVDPPDDTAYGKLVRHHATHARGLDRALDRASVALLEELFSSGGLLHPRRLGPAIAIDVIHYVRRRVATSGSADKVIGEAVAEAIAMFVLPQLEGLDQKGATHVFNAVSERLTKAGSGGALDELRARFADVFPHVKEFTR